MRRLYRKISVTKLKDGKYPVLLSESQWKEIDDAWHMAGEGQMCDENFRNLENQIKIAKGEY